MSRGILSCLDVKFVLGQHPDQRRCWEEIEVSYVEPQAQRGMTFTGHKYRAESWTYEGCGPEKDDLGYEVAEGHQVREKRQVVHTKWLEPS